MKKHMLQKIKLFAIFLGVIFCANVASASWINTPSAPPSTNTYEPLHTGTAGQIKAQGNTYGGLGVGTFFANLDSEFHGDVHIGGTLGTSTFAPKVYLLKFKDGSATNHTLCVDRSDGKLVLCPSGNTGMSSGGGAFLTPGK